MRDTADNATIVCTMENIDPMGVHTGESTVIAPVQSLSDRDHMQLRDMSLSLIREFNIKGGCNVQFAVNQSTGEVRVIEVNPSCFEVISPCIKGNRLSYCKNGCKIAVGYTLMNCQIQLQVKEQQLHSSQLWIIVL